MNGIKNVKGLYEVINAIIEKNGGVVKSSDLALSLFKADVMGGSTPTQLQRRFLEIFEHCRHAAGLVRPGYPPGLKSGTHHCRLGRGAAHTGGPLGRGNAIPAHRGAGHVRAQLDFGVLGNGVGHVFHLLLHVRRTVGEALGNGMELGFNHQKRIDHIGVKVGAAFAQDDLHRLGV